MVSVHCHSDKEKITGIMLSRKYQADINVKIFRLTRSSNGRSQTHSLPKTSSINHMGNNL